MRYPCGTLVVQARESAVKEPQSVLIVALCSWFAREARDLPWRRRRSGYRALVAEAMLQQTQVSRVIERYTAFIKRFPTIRQLADADEQEVLAMWQGLGYYRRARHLHAAAKVIVRDYRGRVPRLTRTLRQLPGVGRYTAAAIASIVYGRREPVVDGNVQRVLARWHARDDPPQDPATIAWAWSRASELVAAAPDPGAFNEALMELGAVVCTPKRPRCSECPVARHCNALHQGCETRIPPPKQTPKQRKVHHYAVVIMRAGKVLLERRSDRGMWSHMWQVPTIEARTPLRLNAIKRALPAPVCDLVRNNAFDHQTTHRRITFHVYTATSRSRRGLWRRADDIADLPMSNPQRRILAMVALSAPRSDHSAYDDQ